MICFIQIKPWYDLWFYTQSVLLNAYDNTLYNDWYLILPWNDYKTALGFIMIDHYKFSAYFEWYIIMNLTFSQIA
jgi:hypothetical protein